MGEIRIELQKGVYFPGEDIGGNVHVYLDKPTSQRSVMLHLIGKERTEVSYTTTSMVGKRTHTTRHTAVEESVFLHQEAPLPLPIDEKGKLEPGNYSIPFKFVLPEGIPVTYRGQHAKILYEVNSKIDVPLGFDVDESSEFQVISNPQTLMPSRTYVSSNSWNDPNSAGLSFTLDRREYGRGEVLNGRCAFRNPHSKNLRKIDIELKWIETARAQGHGATAEVAKQVAEVPLGGRLAKGDNSFNIQIPQGAPLTFYASLCNLRCVLHVGLDIALGSDVAADQTINIVGSSQSAKEMPAYAAERPSYAAKEVSGKVYQPEYADRLTTNIRCQNCGTALRTPNAKYCPNCGSRLDTQTKEMTPPTIQPSARIKTGKSPTVAGMGGCIVCHGELGQGDDVVWCPHCGKLAHREHLMEWIRSKWTCPACGQKLDERQYE